MSNRLEIIFYVKQFFENILRFLNYRNYSIK